MAEQGLEVGVASVEITPDPGIHLGGYWGRKSGATGVHDPLVARALVWRLGDRAAALVALDLVGLDAATVAVLRRRLEAETGIPAAAIMICCTHTHSGPLTVPFRGMGEVDEGYLLRLQEQVCGAVTQALAALRPARLAHQRVPARVGINRRQRTASGMALGQNPEGAVADYAHLVRIEAADGLLATLFSHACHPVVLGNANHQISADFAGAAVRYVEAATGRPALFVNGACGDLNPIRRGDSFREVEEVGAELGRAVVAGLAEARPLKVTDLRYSTRRLELPLVDAAPEGAAEVEKLVLLLRSEIALIADEGGDAWAQSVPRARLAWAEAMLDLVRRGEGKGRTQPFEVQGIAAGELALLGLEGEIFVDYQLDLESRSPIPATVLCGYANGCVGYVPTAAEFARGGYEVEEAYKVYPAVQMLAPESERIIKEAALDLLAELARAA
jgi:hypothetical protein